VAQLGVSWDTLRTYGAVSRETVLEMARGARLALNAVIAISVSGIAGPGGGLPEKPVGTTWIGLSTREGEWAQRHQFSGVRRQNKILSADAALQMLVDYLEGKLS
jgi:PncC family amidohydrolase